MRTGLRGLGDRLVAPRAIRHALVETVDNLERIFRGRGDRPNDQGGGDEG